MSRAKLVDVEIEICDTWNWDDSTIYGVHERSDDEDENSTFIPNAKLTQTELKRCYKACHDFWYWMERLGEMYNE